MKYLLVLVVVLVIFGLVASRARRRRRADGESRRESAGAVMVACSHCGLHVPAQEALRDATGRAFCGEEHRRLMNR